MTKNGKQPTVESQQLKVENWGQADRAMLDYAAAQNVIARERAKMDAEILAITEKYADSVGNPELAAAATEQALKKFAQAHKAEFKAAPNGDGRSYEHAGVTLGFRQSPGRVEIRKEEEAIEWLRDYREGAFVRVVHQANREALLEALRDAKPDSRLVETLAAHGIKFEQKDKFFLEVKRDS